MRYGAAEYLGSSNDTALYGYHVLGWVTGHDPATGLRNLKVVMVRDFPAQPGCTSQNTTGQGSITLRDITDVYWVHHGGHVPAGQGGTVRYPSHGYLVYNDAGDEVTEPRVAVGRFWEANGILRDEPVYLELGGSPAAPVMVYPVGITPSMASNRPVPLNQNVTSDFWQSIMHYFCRGFRTDWGPI